VPQERFGVPDARIESQPPSDSAKEEQRTVEVAPSQPTPSFAIAHWRMIAVAGAALLALIVGLLLIRSKHQTRLQQERSRAAHVVPVQQGLPAVAHGEQTPPRVSVATAASGAVPATTRQAPASDNNAQKESFSEAFVKHAASVNSNWAEVKKRPKVSEPSQPVRSAASGNPSNAKPAANPLDVLDKLEKARKAKKTGGS